jgi:hypothetical protein
MFLKARNPKGLNRIAKIGHIRLREENLAFNNNYTI